MSLTLAVDEQRAVTPVATVFVVDDDPEVRRSLSLLARSVDLHVETFASASEFLEGCDEDRIGCIVLDARMPGIPGLELQRQLAAKDFKLPIIFVTAYGEIPMAAQAMRAGALDFIQKPFSPQALLDRIREAIDVSLERHRKRRACHETNTRIAKLTAREREVMYLLAAGDSTKVIASRLGISPKTVDNHRIRILEKMDARSTIQLAHFLFNLN